MPKVCIACGVVPQPKSVKGTGKEEWECPGCAPRAKPAKKKSKKK